MDELELLKKDWNKQPDKKRISVKDIYPMLHKKSSSIVKTLFYISIAELVFWILVNTLPYFTSAEYQDRLNTILSETMVTILTAISYGVILFFIYLLYKSYKAISVTDNVKKLMKSIINIRKIIKYYVIYNLLMVFSSSAIALVYAINHDPSLENISNYSDKELAVFTGISILIIGAFMVGIWLFYKLIYGFLLKRLNRNYKELAKLEV